MDKRIELSQEDAIRIWKILDNLRVSLDRIGAISQQGRDKMRIALDDYFTSGIYKEIADCDEVVVRLLIKTLGEDAVLKLSRESRNEKFQLKKY